MKRGVIYSGIKILIEYHLISSN